MRKQEIVRKTKETDIKLSLNLDGGTAEISTGIGFFDHMLTLFSVHSGFGLSVKCVGDIAVDYHHSVEDVGIALGTAYKNAVGDKKGIRRYASVSIPMDEALTTVAVDVSGRSYLVFNAQKLTEGKTGDFDCQLVEEFMHAFSSNAGITLHINYLYGTNYHHIAESIFKGLAHALKHASEIVSDKVLSSKGSL